MWRPTKTLLRVGVEAQPICILDNFAPDPGRLRQVALDAHFGRAGDHYPGLRADLPPDYLADQLPVVARAMARQFGRCRALRVIDASYSMVTDSAGALTPSQRVPHVDAYGAERIALVHYLWPAGGDGTAFYRHRSTGFETIDDGRAPVYRARLAEEMAREGTVGTTYVGEDTPLFERTEVVESRYNRAVLYRSFLLHSGAISPDNPLSADPGEGRLTITGFLAME